MFKSVFMKVGPWLAGWLVREMVERACGRWACIPESLRERGRAPWLRRSGFLAG